MIIYEVYATENPLAKPCFTKDVNGSVKNSFRRLELSYTHSGFEVGFLSASLFAAKCHHLI